MLRAIRESRSGDRDALLALRARLEEDARASQPGRGGGTGESYVAALADWLADEDEDGALLVAEAHDGSVLGFAPCFVREVVGEAGGHEVSVEDAVTAGGPSRFRIGRALAKAACDFARRRGIGRVVLSTSALDTLVGAGWGTMAFRPVAVTLQESRPAGKGGSP